jgi:hypothetical protein
MGRLRRASRLKGRVRYGGLDSPIPTHGVLVLCFPPVAEDGAYIFLPQSDPEEMKNAPDRTDPSWA